MALTMRAQTDRQPVEAISSTELAERAEVSYRQVDYWTRIGLLVPATEPTPGSGNGRGYQLREVAVARLLWLVMPWRSAAGNHIPAETVFALTAWVRAGGRGQVPLLVGVTLDLDLICEGSPAAA